MSPVYVWAIATVFLLGAELLIGSFFMLMIAAGTTVGILLALIHLNVENQMIGAACVAALMTVGWYYYRRKYSKSLISSRNRDALIDIGQKVYVAKWDENHNTKVKYRGAEWEAQWIGHRDPITGYCEIKAITGSQLQLDYPSNQEKE